MDAISEMQPEVHFEIFSRTPRWFFDQSLKATFNLNPETTDVGFAQKSPFQVDLNKTIDALDEFLPFREDYLERLASIVREKQCLAIFCDISPLGIAVAKRADLTSVLLENFTWEWLYEAVSKIDNRYDRFIDLLRELTSQADCHVLLEPFCHPYPADNVVPPVSRRPRRTKDLVRGHLDVPTNAVMVLVCMGGVPEYRFEYLERLRAQQSLYFVVPGAAERTTRQDNLILLPHHSDFYHPDLMHAADLAVGKLGYSTLAEVYAAGIPFLFVTRPDSRETDPLARFVIDNMEGTALTEPKFQAADWLSMLPEFLDAPLQERKPLAGSEQAARFLLGIDLQ